MYHSNPITAPGQFTDAEFMSAAQKRNVLRIKSKAKAASGDRSLPLPDPEVKP